MVPEHGLDRELVRSVQPDKVLDSLLDFDPAHWGLPPLPHSSEHAVTTGA